MFNMYKVLVIALCVECGYTRIAEDIRSNEINRDSDKTHTDAVNYQAINTTHPQIGNSTDNIQKNIDTNKINKDNTSDIRIDLNVTTTSENGAIVIDFSEPMKPDYGEPLILTPLIKKGRIKEARRASKVNPELFFGLASYSGYLTVNESYNSNLFFWYFPVPEKPPGETPWLIWLQGGPGASCMTGLFDEIGPFTVDEHFQLKLRNETWGANHSLLFIENPVGTGFSFTDSNLGYTNHVNTSSAQLYVGLQQFLDVFPELRAAPLFITGESYAGKYVPGLANEIHRRRNNTHQPINLQGLAIGNGFIEPSSIANYSRVAYHFGIIDQASASELEMLEREFLRQVETNDSIAAKNAWFDCIFTLHLMIYQNQIYNLLKDELAMRRYEALLKRADIRKALHVGAVPYRYVNETVNKQFALDFLSNSRPVLESLLEHYRVLIYSGHLDMMVPYVLTAENLRTWSWSGRGQFDTANRHQHGHLDMMVPYVLTAENLRTWSWSGREQFDAAERHPWVFAGKVAGYHRSGGNLTEVLVRGAGHMAPADRPAPLRDLIEGFVRGRPPSGRGIPRVNRRAYVVGARATADAVFYL